MKALGLGLFAQYRGPFGAQPDNNQLTSFTHYRPQSHPSAIVGAMK